VLDKHDNSYQKKEWLFSGKLVKVLYRDHFFADRCSFWHTNISDQEEQGMDLGDIVMVDNPRHPFYGRRGKIIGRRGLYREDDPWFLIYVPSHMRSFLIPQSMLCLEQDASVTVDIFTERLQ